MTQIEARYSETDQMGVIYHGNYPTWFEVARTDYIHDRLHPFDQFLNNVLQFVSYCKSFLHPLFNISTDTYHTLNINIKKMD
jgi:YbgC/YbaW family acyl-CoA thioester hydrolase